MDVEDVEKEMKVQSAKPQADLTPIDRLQFAKWVLKGIFVFFVLSVGVRMYQESSGETLMEICRTGLLPIASFVIGDYFGSRGQ